MCVTIQTPTRLHYPLFLSSSSIFTPPLFSPFISAHVSSSPLISFTHLFLFNLWSHLLFPLTNLFPITSRPSSSSLLCDKLLSHPLTCHCLCFSPSWNPTSFITASLLVNAHLSSYMLLSFPSFLISPCLSPHYPLFHIPLIHFLCHFSSSKIHYTIS